MRRKKIQTGFPGVRYREHPTRKHGAMKDRYYFIRSQFKLEDGTFIRREEGLGWASKGWSPSKANEELAQLKKAQRTGDGPRSLKEGRKIADQKKQAEEELEKEEVWKKITFGEYFLETYFPAQTSKKQTSREKEMSLYKHWIGPTIGSKPFHKISSFPDIETIKKKLLENKRTPKTIDYVFAVIRQVWNMARKQGYLLPESPTKAVAKPKKDNRRLRFLTREEADKLLLHLKKASQQLHDMALLSLHTGMRAGEIFNLTWGDLDIKQGTILILDPKTARNRVAYMTKDVSRMFRALKAGEKTSLVFKDRRHGGKIKEISHVFRKEVDALLLNEGVEDPRLKVVFHTLRHTFASWMVENGENIYTVKELMGHSTLAMTTRYSHLGPNTMRDAVKRLDKKISKKKNADKNKLAQKEGTRKRALTVMK